MICMELEIWMKDLSCVATNSLTENCFFFFGQGLHGFANGGDVKTSPAALKTCCNSLISGWESENQLYNSSKSQKSENQQKHPNFSEIHG